MAGAYKIERDKVGKQQFYFSIVFYGTILSIIIYAAIFILPIVKNVVGFNGDGSISAEDSVILLFVRLLILAPAVWALIFTNKRYSYLETLQMDYAAKATTALAYSGYRDEMSDDSELSKQLKYGLVMRFLEHPSRLLGKKMEFNSSEVGPDGAHYTASTRSSETKSSKLEGSETEA